MNGFWALLRKELLELFASPAAYAVVAVFWMASGYFFSFSLFFLQANEMVNSFHNLSLLLLLVAPILTMRVFAEEAASGTLELLFALPFGVGALVAAKYVVLLILLALLLLGSAAALIPLGLYAQPDWGPILGGYLGLFLFGAAALAVGTFVSSWTRSQVVAAVLTWGCLLLLWFVDYGSHVAHDQGGYTLTRVLRHLSLSLHTRGMIRGSLDGSSVVYLLTLAIVLLVWTAQALRWRRV